MLVCECACRLQLRTKNKVLTSQLATANAAASTAQATASTAAARAVAAEAKMAAAVMRGDAAGAGARASPTEGHAGSGAPAPDASATTKVLLQVRGCCKEPSAGSGSSIVCALQEIVSMRKALETKAEAPVPAVQTPAQLELQVRRGCSPRCEPLANPLTCWLHWSVRARSLN